jgi:hypothetical protein
VRAWYIANRRARKDSVYCLRIERQSVGVRQVFQRERRVLVLLKLSNFPQKGTARTAQLSFVRLQALQDGHVALSQDPFTMPVHVGLTRSVSSFSHVLLCSRKRGHDYYQHSDHYSA